jgi:hypothetical protein
MRRPVLDVDEVFWQRVDKTDGCWLWMGERDPLGYGRFRWRGRKSTSVLAHRNAYEMVVGPIPEGLTIDHLCRNPACVNPAHLEPVTNEENVRRGLAGAYNRVKTHCKNGHPFDEENTAVYYGKRACRTCRRMWGREYERNRRRLARAS